PLFIFINSLVFTLNKLGFSNVPLALNSIIIPDLTLPWLITLTIKLGSLYPIIIPSFCGITKGKWNEPRHRAISALDSATPFQNWSGQYNCNNPSCTLSLKFFLLGKEGSSSGKAFISLTTLPNLYFKVPSHNFGLNTCIKLL